MEEVSVDIVVIGSGAAGMTTAIRAAQGGARVIVFEKRPFPGGASNTPMCIASTKKDPAYRDLAFKTHMEMTQQAGNGPLVRAWINKSGDIPEWLTDLGYKLGPVMASATLETMGKQRGYGVGFPNGYYIHDVHFLPGRGFGHGGALLIRHFVKKAEELGVDIRLGTPVKKIRKDGERVCGVIAEDKAGNQVKVDAKAVVVASAGFNGDADMIKKFGGYGGFKLDTSSGGWGDGDGDLFFGWPHRMTGDGQKMAWEIGADRGSMGVGLITHMPKQGVGWAWLMKLQLMTIIEQPYLWVNQQGLRFYNEEYANDHMTASASWARQNPKCAYIVFDSATRRRMEEKGPDYQYFIFGAMTIPEIDDQFDQAIAAGNKGVFVADTLEELAEKSGIDREGLINTVADYNGCCDKGHDDLFAKDPKFLFPVKDPKFYAIKGILCAYQTIGGIRVNGKTEALTNARKVIPGLYAAGDIVAAEIFGDPPVNGVGTLGFAVSSGLISAESALEYINK